MKGAGAPRKRRRKYRKTGAYALERALRQGGLDALDGRLAQVRDARSWAADVARDQGGDDVLPATYRELLEAAMGARLIVSHMTGVLLAQPEWIVNRRRRCLSQLAKDYLGAVKHLRETLVVLGLERVPPKMKTLAEILSEPVPAQQAPTGRAQAPAVDPTATPVPHDATAGQGTGEETT